MSLLRAKPLIRRGLQPDRYVTRCYTPKSLVKNSSNLC